MKGSRFPLLLLVPVLSFPKSGIRSLNYEVIAVENADDMEILRVGYSFVCSFQAKQGNKQSVSFCFSNYFSEVEAVRNKFTHILLTAVEEDYDYTHMRCSM